MASSQVLPTSIKSLLPRCEPFLVLKNRAGTKKYTFHLCFVLLFLMLWPNNWDEVTQEGRAYFDWQSSRSDSNMGRHAHSGEWGGWSIASMDRKQGLDGEGDLAVKSQDPAPSGQLSPMKHPPSLKSFTTLPKSISITIWEWDIQTHEPVGIIPQFSLQLCGQYILLCLYGCLIDLYFPRFHKQKHANMDTHMF